MEPGTKGSDVEPARPLLIGGHPAIDFVNSCYGTGSNRVDWLSSGATLQRWLELSGSSLAPIFAASQTLSAADLDSAAGKARDLREWVRGLLAAWSASGAPAVPRSAVKQMNTYLGLANLRQAFVSAGDGFALRTERVMSGPNGLVAELAAQTADLLANYPASRTHKCANPECTLWFIDLKQGPVRRWCSMAICGNRMKVAAHRARARARE